MRTYDFIVVGGGILGASTALHLKKQFQDGKILLLEKEHCLAVHQTGHNSGVIHAGIYYAPKSLKSRFCIEGNRRTKEFCQLKGISFKECGKILVATNDLEVERLKVLWGRTARNGLERHWLDRKQLQEKEPNIEGKNGIFVPSSGIVDYSEITQAVVEEFISLGGELRLGVDVQAIDESSRDVKIMAGKESFSAAYLVSCAGLMSDKIIKMLGLKSDFTICPFRGEYFRLPQHKSNLVRHLIYPVPDPSMPFLGIHLTPMINGDLIIGPNAVLALKREGYKKTDINLFEFFHVLLQPGVAKVLIRHFKSGVTELKNSYFKGAYVRQVKKYCPSVTVNDLLPYPAGVRAQAIHKSGKLIDDFHFFESARSLNVCNAPSPAATSAFPIGAYITEKINIATKQI